MTKFLVFKRATRSPLINWAFVLNWGMGSIWAERAASLKIDTENLERESSWWSSEERNQAGLSRNSIEADGQWIVNVVGHKFMAVRHKFNMVGHHFMVLRHKFNVVGHKSSTQDFTTHPWGTSAQVFKVKREWVPSKNERSTAQDPARTRNKLKAVGIHHLTFARIELYRSDRTLLCSRVGEEPSRPKTSASYPFVALWLSHLRGGRLVILMRMIRDNTDKLNHCATPGTKHL